MAQEPKLMVLDFKLNINSKASFHLDKTYKLLLLVLKGISFYWVEFDISSFLQLHYIDVDFFILAATGESVSFHSIMTQVFTLNHQNNSI